MIDGHDLEVWRRKAEDCRAKAQGKVVSLRKPSREPRTSGPARRDRGRFECSRKRTANQGRGDVDDEASGKVKDADALFSRLKRRVKSDYNSKGQVAWRKEVREDFDFAGEQLNEDDKAILQDAKRPIVIFNRVGTTVDSVSGQEVGNRQEVQFLPRRQGVVKKNELLTSAAKWFRQQCDAEDEESESFAIWSCAAWDGTDAVAAVCRVTACGRAGYVRRPVRL